MQLSKIEQRMFDGDEGEACRQSMEILVALGKIYGATRMIPVTSAQVAGVSYKTIGEAGLDYLADLAKVGARVRIPTFLNPAGMDRDQWEKMHVPAEFAKKQIAVLDAFAKMGIMQTCTCTPYLIGIRPKVGEHVAWAESSAVSFCNSVLGARTNREGGPSALAAGICGVTPEYGLHLDQNRKAGILVKVEAELKTASDFGAMGYCVGEMVKNKIPAFAGVKEAGEGKLKALGAAMAASGSVALYYVKGITPEYVVGEGVEEIVFTEKDLAATKEKMGGHDKPDLIAIGCPHASIDEIKEIADKVKGKKIACELWVCTARETKKKSDEEGYTAAIEKAGGLVVADTCMVVCPVGDMGHKVTATNSGKAAKYLPTMGKQKVVFGSADDIIFAK